MRLRIMRLFLHVREVVSVRERRVTDRRTENLYVGNNTCTCATMIFLFVNWVWKRMERERETKRDRERVKLQMRVHAHLFAKEGAWEQ